MLTDKLKNFIKDYPDFPKNGIIFKDLCPILCEPNIFWVWVVGDPCLIASPELSHVAGAITITIPEIIQIVGPDLHHFRSFIDECSAVVGPA